MAYSLTDSLQHHRFSVVSVDEQAGVLRVKGEAEACTDLSCQGAVVVDEVGDRSTLKRLFPGDIITMEEQQGRARQIVVVRRAWDEYSSPEW
jgi:hypothetical protein